MLDCGIVALWAGKPKNLQNIIQGRKKTDISTYDRLGNLDVCKDSQSALVGKLHPAYSTYVEVSSSKFRGPVSKQMMSAKSVRQRFKRLVDRIVDGGVIPFIGAGVSLYAVCSSAEHLGCTIAKTEDMEEKVRLALGKPQSTRTDKPKPSLAQLAEEYLWARCSENHPMLYKSLVCDILHIHDFVSLSPLPAHRYIAFLAREGCIEEIITSNYDICLSTAFEDSFDAESGQTRPRAIEVATLHEYRQYSGRRYQAGKEGFLKVYHINGCAKHLDPNGKDIETECKRIMLTESQLQDWRQRHWSREMFKDRLRTRSICFSGFGSPEPQVRHTVTQVTEEFTSQPQQSVQAEGSGKAKDQAPWSLPNAPFIQAYKEDLTFEQKQIMFGFGSIRDSFSYDKLLKDGNCFTGRDYGYFHSVIAEGAGKSEDDDKTTEKRNSHVPRPSTTQSEDEGSKLPADTFWQCVYTAVFWELLMRELRPGSAFWYFIDSLIPCASALMRDLRLWLLPTGRSGDGDLFGRFPELLALPEVEQDSVDDTGAHKLMKSTRLSCYVWPMRYRGRSMQDGWYAALSDRCMLIPSFFLILYLLYGTGPDAAETWADIEDSIVFDEDGSNIGIGLKLNGDPRLLVSLAHHESCFQAGKVKIADSDDLFEVNTIVQVVIGHSTRARQSSLFMLQDIDGKPCQPVRYANCWQVPLSDLLRDRFPRGRGYRISTPEDVVAAFHRNLKACIPIVDSHRKRLSEITVPVMKGV